MSLPLLPICRSNLYNIEDVKTMAMAGVRVDGQDMAREVIEFLINNCAYVNNNNFETFPRPSLPAKDSVDRHDHGSVAKCMKFGKARHTRTIVGGPGTIFTLVSGSGVVRFMLGCVFVCVFASTEHVLNARPAERVQRVVRSALLLVW